MIHIMEKVDVRERDAILVSGANSVGNRFRNSGVAKSSTVGSTLTVSVGSVSCVETALGHMPVTMLQHYWLRAMKKLILQ